MKRFFLMSFLLAVLLLLARATQADDDVASYGPSVERPAFFDHGYRTGYGLAVRLRHVLRRDIDAPRRVGDRVRFTLRDRDYVAAWIETDADDWEKQPLELDSGADRWTIDLELPPGRTRYVFVVEDDDGDRRVRTDTSNPRRRRDVDRNWVSVVELDERGQIVERHDRPRRRRDDRVADVDLFDDVVLNYQRVDGFSLGLRSRVITRDPWSPKLDASFTYGFSSDRWSARLSLLQPLTEDGLFRAHVSAYDRTDTVDRTGVGPWENSIATLAFREDSYDWYRREGLTFGIEADVEDHLLTRIEFRSDEHTSLPRTVIAGWGGREDFLPNPAIDEGLVRSLFLRARVGTDLDHLWVEFETSDDDFAPTAHDFTQITAQYRTRLRLGRDGHFDLRVRYGDTLAGELPRQRRFVAGGIGTVRGYRYQSVRTGADPGDGYGGERLLLANAELALGDEDMAIALFADAGQVWIDREDDLDLDDVVTSLGIGLLLDEDDDEGLRVDLIRPLEGDGDLMVQLRLRRPF